MGRFQLGLSVAMGVLQKWRKLPSVLQTMINHTFGNGFLPPRKMVFFDVMTGGFIENPNLKWMMTGGTPLSESPGFALMLVFHGDLMGFSRVKTRMKRQAAGKFPTLIKFFLHIWGWIDRNMMKWMGLSSIFAGQGHDFRVVSAV